MNAITRAPSGSPLAANLRQTPTGADKASVAERGNVHETKVGTGALQGHQIGVGDSGSPPQPAASQQLPRAVQAAVVGVQLQVPQTPQARQAILTRAAAQPQPLPSKSSLYAPQPGGLATNAAVLEKLQAHAKAAGTDLTPKEIAGYVALGEHAANALQQPATALARQLGEVVVNTVNPPVVLTPNMETARGISWYIAACAAQQDVNQQATGSAAMVNGKEVSNLTVKGAFVFNDPNNAIYKFLQSSPLAYSRISSHFHERSASDGMIGSRPEQRGIEDYDRRLPGQNGAMLFDKLKGAPGKEEMFLKFEHTGYPEVSTSAQRVDDQGQGLASGWRALGRKIAHALSFIQTRFEGAMGVNRKEHVHKGL
ncbi:hypothetical protein ACFQOZ_13245 [Comamonas endophytica]